MSESKSYFSKIITNWLCLPFFPPWCDKARRIEKDLHRFWNLFVVW